MRFAQNGGSASCSSIEHWTAADKKAQRDKKAKEKADNKLQPQNALPIS